MIVLQQRFAFREGTSDQERAAVLAAMRRTASVESAAFSTVGRELGDGGEGFTHGYCVGIEDLGALERYMHDPVHLAGDPDILPHLARLSLTIVSDDADPDLAAKIDALHRRKLAAHPEWDELLASIPDGRPERGTAAPSPADGGAPDA